jgi:hypothetical protein
MEDEPMIRAALLIAAGTRVTVSVRDRAQVAPTYGQRGDRDDERGFRLSSGATSVRFEACPASEAVRFGVACAT